MTDADLRMCFEDAEFRAGYRSLMANLSEVWDAPETRATGTFDELDAPEGREE